MEAETRALFNDMFQEAHVIDLDFSEWDRRVRLVVAAGLLPENFDRGSTIHQVDFVHVKELAWEATDLDTVLDAPQHHCQWVIFERKIERRRGFYDVELRGMSPTPTMRIVCRDIAIAELDPALVGIVNPRWNRPYVPLARPGIANLAAIWQRRSHRRQGNKRRGKRS